MINKRRRQKHYVIDFDNFMYDRTLYRGREHSCRCCFQTSRTEEIVKSHINECFKINDKQMIHMSKEVRYLTFKYYERKIKSLFMIYADFHIVMVLENNKNQNPEKCYSKKNTKNILLPVVVINQYLLVINLMNLVKRTQVKMLFAGLLII